MPPPTLRLLLVEDSPQIAKSVELSLRPEGFEIDVATSIEEARGFHPFERYRLALVDLMLPDGSGLDLCAELKIKKPGLPIIIITAKADEDSLVQGLAIADDYVRKPFGKRELLARIQKTLNEKISRTKVLEFGSLKLFPDTGLAEVSGTALNLRPREFSILSLLIINGEDTVDRERILRVVDRDADMYERSLDSHLSRIRKALQRAGVKDVEVLTVHGSGYRLKKAA